MTGSTQAARTGSANAANPAGDIRAIGWDFGSSYPNIWDDPSVVADNAVRYIAPIAARIALLQKIRRRIEWVWFSAAWIVGISFVLAATGAFGSRVAGGLSVTLALAWVIFMVLWWGALQSASVRQRDHRERWRVFLIQSGGEACWEAVSTRREQARSHEPGARATMGEFQPAGPAPLPQPYGVSPQGAEALVAAWMKYLGEEDAVCTRFVADGGIDVASSHYIAQVKHYVGTVGVAEVRELGGVASIQHRKALFFTSGVYAKGAVDFADAAGIALFKYSAELGTLQGANSLGARAVVLGL